ncbi:hypothetical protein JIG36_51100 [Actinoplanes sp. LDG1-06]|uniref:Uncharacterized protein n=1 Tax=Paractinoplanes ovalisporus TaxID=2810368 RepID=A0ABS2AVG7_9ACTN|nr:hypothetical protein [Actinoplanes ovalisporus]MBM2623867.1 hypothetical protein [Actinoplanes ovalisporus]
MTSDPGGRIGWPVSHPAVAAALDRLAAALREITACDPSMAVELGQLDPAEALDQGDAYARRNRAVLVALGAAVAAGLSAGIGVDPAYGTEWPVVYIDLPTGQVSWHVTAYGPTWDGHTTTEKYARIAEWLADPHDQGASVPTLDERRGRYLSAVPPQTV